MIGGKVGGLALFLFQLRRNESRLRAAAQKGAEAEAQRTVEALQERIPVDSGEARDSIRWEPIPGGGARVLVGGPETTPDTYDYVRELEFGRIPNADGKGGRQGTAFFRTTTDETRSDGPERIKAGIISDMEE